MPEIPQRLRSALNHRYPIERELGSGGMATVYLGRDLKHDRPVAVKVLHEEYAAGLGADRFLREIDIAAKLTHPHILPLYDSGDAEGYLYYVMPYVEGESLRQRIVREQELPIEEAIQIARQVADALSHAHKQGVIHRDIKPENILLEEGEAVVADFGVARALSAAAGDGLTGTGFVVGTPRYMSPEQATGDRELDARTDIYALGCVLHEMLTGDPPFTGHTPQAVIARHVMETLPSLRVVRPAVPTWLEHVVHTALAKAPADRFATAEAFSQALAAQAEPRLGLRRRVLRGWRRKLGVGVGIAAASATIYFGSRALELRVERGRQLPIDSASLFDPSRVAVLYFDDYSEGQELGYLRAGFTRQLIHELDGVETLDVISFNGVKPYRDTKITLDSLAQVLTVGSIVGGSLTRSGDSLRVHVELTDAATAELLASTELQRPLGELFALQDDIASEVSRFLRERLGTAIRLRERLAGANSVEAWQLTQKAQQVLEDYRTLEVKEGDTATAHSVLKRAMGLLAQAEALDPRWAEPMVRQGWVAQKLARLLSEVPGQHDPSSLAEGLRHAERALKLNGRDATALELRGTLRYCLARSSADPAHAGRLLESAETDLRAAVAEDPALASAWSTLSRLLHEAKGEFDEARRAADRAFEEDEFLEVDAEYLAVLANLALDARDYEEALEWAKRGQRRFPDRVDFRAAELIVYTMADGPAPDLEHVWRLFGLIQNLTPPADADYHVPDAALQVAAVLARAGLQDSARALLERTRAAASDSLLAYLSYTEAHTRLRLGERDEALQALALYLKHRPDWATYIAADPWFRELRDDPRFKQLVGATE